MSNRIDQLLTELKERKGIKVPEFAKACGLKPSTIYGIRKKPTMDNVTIDVFLKIAHGLGMTAEELYYGDERPNKMTRTYADPRQQEINETFEGVTEDGKQVMWTNAVMTRTTFPDGVERGDVQEEAAE